jgi:hypothetical protein
VEPGTCASSGTWHRFLARVLFVDGPNTSSEQKAAGGAVIVKKGYRNVAWMTCSFVPIAFLAKDAKNNPLQHLDSNLQQEAHTLVVRLFRIQPAERIGQPSSESDHSEGTCLLSSSLSAEQELLHKVKGGL